MVWRGSGGNKIYNGVRETFSLLDNIGKSNVLASAVPLGIRSAPHQSDLWLESGNYLRLENLSFGYRINVTNVKYINSVRVSLTGNNLLLITKYTGIDPELDVSGGSGAGYDGGTYPRSRTFALGINVVFK
jgi:hypothetical protein